MEYYALSTIQQVKNWFEQYGDSTSDDDILYTYLLETSRWVSRVIGDMFVPEIKTRKFDSVGDHVSNVYHTLFLGRAIADITSLTISSVAYTEDTDFEKFPFGEESVHELLALDDTNLWYSSSDWRNAIAIAGTWCWHHDYSSAWQSSGDTVQDGSGLTASVTEITVTDVDATGWDGIHDRFSPGNFIRIGTEFMAVTAVNTDTNKITVIRGVNGSTAATHDNSDEIDVFWVMPEIQRAINLITAFRYANRGNTTRVRYDSVSVVESVEIPNEAADIIERFRLEKLLEGSA